MASPAGTSDCSGIMPGLRITGMKGAGQGANMVFDEARCPFTHPFHTLRIN